MRRASIVLVVLFLMSLAVAGCGSGPLAKMTVYEAQTFELDYPEAWQQSGMDFMGVTIAFLSEEELAPEDFGRLDQPPGSAFVMIMYTPSAEAEFRLEDFDEEITEDEDVKITSKGDITVGGQRGKYAKARGEVEDSGDEFGMMVVVVEDGDNTFSFIGMSPAKSWSKNERIFDYMVKTVKFQ